MLKCGLNASFPTTWSAWPFRISRCHFKHTHTLTTTHIHTHLEKLEFSHDRKTENVCLDAYLLPSHKRHTHDSANTQTHVQINSTNSLFIMFKEKKGTKPSNKRTNNEWVMCDFCQKFKWDLPKMLIITISMITMFDINRVICINSIHCIKY